MNFIFKWDLLWPLLSSNLFQVRCTLWPFVLGNSCPDIKSYMKTRYGFTVPSHCHVASVPLHLYTDSNSITRTKEAEHPGQIPFDSQRSRIVILRPCDLLDYPFVFMVCMSCPWSTCLRSLTLVTKVETYCLSRGLPFYTSYFWVVWDRVWFYPFVEFRFRRF